MCVLSTTILTSTYSRLDNTTLKSFRVFFGLRDRTMSLRIGTGHAEFSWQVSAGRSWPIKPFLAVDLPCLFCDAALAGSCRVTASSSDKALVRYGVHQSPNIETSHKTMARAECCACVPPRAPKTPSVYGTKLAHVINRWSDGEVFHAGDILATHGTKDASRPLLTTDTIRQYAY
jgi:hypothetical protein